MENAKQEMMKNKLDLLDIHEVRWGGSGIIESCEQLYIIQEMRRAEVME